MLLCEVVNALNVNLDPDYCYRELYASANQNCVFGRKCEEGGLRYYSNT